MFVEAPILDMWLAVVDTAAKAAPKKKAKPGSGFDSDTSDSDSDFDAPDKAAASPAPPAAAAAVDPAATAELQTALDDVRGRLTSVEAAARDALRNKAEGGHESYRAKRRAENDEFIALLRAEPFDASALEAVLEGQAQKREDFQSAVRRAWLLQLTEMSYDDREDYADRVERRMRQGRGGSRK